MSDQDPADAKLNQGPGSDRADYASGSGASPEVKASKDLSIKQSLDSATEQANNWRGNR